ncbi:BTAD domain-containing putative transcriptional regulator [Streptomyces mirabilis]
MTVSPDFSLSDRRDGIVGEPLRFSILGPLRIWRGTTELDPGPPQRRILLATLLAHGGRPVGLPEIVYVLWGENSPATALNVVQRHVGQLRRLLEPNLPIRCCGRWIAGSAGSYRVNVDNQSLDLLEFRAQAARARQAGLMDARTGAALFGAALSLYQGPAGQSLPPAARSHPLFTALDRECCAVALEAADLALHAGAPGAVLRALEQVGADHPLNEALHARLILVQSAAGHRDRAASSYTRLKVRLREELRLSPGRELQAAYAQVIGATQKRPAQPGAPAHGYRILADREPPQAHPAQLPAELTVFVGRLELLGRAMALTPHKAGGAPIVVTGMPGVGKSAFALHWSQRVADRFPDGQLYVNLRGSSRPDGFVRSSHALAGMLSALGIRQRGIPRGIQDRAALYRSLMARRRMLVLIDDADDPEQVRYLLPGTTGGLTVVTSRSRLEGLVVAIGAHMLPIGVFSEAESRKCLTRRLGAARMNTEPAAATRIIELCGGLPLALAAVATRAVSQPSWSLAELATDLESTEGTLDAFTGPSAATDLRASFASSYRGLTPGTARLFRQLALHPGAEFTLSLTAALGSLTAAESRAVAHELVQSGLMTESNPGVLSWHRLVRSFALELADRSHSGDEMQAARRRLIDGGILLTAQTSE